MLLLWFCGPVVSGWRSVRECRRFVLRCCFFFGLFAMQRNFLLSVERERGVSHRRISIIINNRSGAGGARACTAKGGVSRPGARVLRLLLAAMGDDAERARAPCHDRAALGLAGLTTLKAKRPAAERPAAEATDRAADAELAPTSDDTIILAIDEGAEAIAGGGAAEEVAAAAQVIASLSGGMFVYLYIRILAVLCVREGVLSVLG